MLHQSASRRVGLLAVVLAAGLAIIAAPVSAQQTRVDIPADAPVVAGPTASGAKLVAFLHDGQLCTTTVGGKPSGLIAIGGDDICDAVPALTPFGHQQLVGAWPNGLIAMVVGTGVTAVELRQGGRRLVRRKLMDSPLPGAAADLRFALLETDESSPANELALLDRSGAVRRVSDQADPNGLPGIRDESAASAGSIVQRGRLGRVPWTVRAGTLSVLASTPLQPERRVTRACVSLRSTDPYSAFADATLADGTCERDEDADQPIVASLSTGCPPMGSQLAVLARAAVGRVVVVLGDGTRQAIPLTAVPGAVELRAGGLVLSVGVAVRRMVALDRSGSVLLNMHLGLEPVTAHENCTETGPGVTTYSIRRSELVLPHAVPHTPVVIDRGTDICVGVDRGLREPTDCGPAPIDPDDVQLLSRTTPNGRHLFGIVPADVAGARLERDDGTVLEVPAISIPGYLGQYAGLLRMISVDVAGPHRVVDHRLLDARGRMLVNDFSPFSGPDQPALRQRTKLRRLPGVPALQIALRPGNGDEPSTACLALGPLRDESECEHLSPGTTFTVLAECAPRRILVYGGLRRATDRLVVRTASGREIAGRTLVLPAPVRGADGVAAVAMVALGPEDAPRRLIRRGHVPRQGPFVLPAVGRQCGYDSWASLPDDRGWT